MKNEILNVADMLATADAAGLDFAAAKKARSSALSAAVRFLCDALPITRASSLRSSHDASDINLHTTARPARPPSPRQISRARLSPAHRTSRANARAGPAIASPASLHGAHMPRPSVHITDPDRPHRPHHVTPAATHAASPGRPARPPQPA